MSGMTTTSGGRQVSRRSNAERSAATRTIILDATIHCLHRKGFGAVTNHQVAEAAGVSRGAMMHHFPTRLDLLAAAVRHAQEKVQAHRRQAMAALPAGLPRYQALVEVCWQSASMPEGLALTELRVGARSDPEVARALAPAFLDVAEKFARFLGGVIRGAGMTPDEEMRGVFVTVAMSLRALAIDRFTYPSPEMVRQVLGTLQQLCDAQIRRQLPGLPAPAPGPATTQPPEGPQPSSGD